MATLDDMCRLAVGCELKDVVVVDLETTGLDAYYDEILSIGICDGNGKPIYSSYVRPTRTASWPEAEAVNGISPSMVANAPTAEEIAPSIAFMLSNANAIVGYNASFDLGFLRACGAVDYTVIEDFDVMKEYAELHGSRKAKWGERYQYSKLAQCALSYGYEFSAHDAMEDAKATAHCFRAIICDRLFVKKKIAEVMERQGFVRFAQTNETRSNIGELFPSGLNGEVGGEMKVGEVTRGKNKGAARYECFVSNKRVGVASQWLNDEIRKLFMLSESEELPDNIPCVVAIDSRGDVSVSAKIADTPPNLTAVLESAETLTTEHGFEWRNAPEIVEKPKQVNRPVASKRSEQKKKSGVLPIVLIVIGALFDICGAQMTMDGDTAGGISAVIIGIIVAAFGFYRRGK